MDCLTCEQVTAEFERLEQRYSEALRHLTDTRGSAPIGEYKRTKVELNEAWLKYEVARIELERHRRTHT